MDYYLNAEEQLRSADILANAGEYRTSVTHLFLACELYLKSLLETIDPDSEFLDKHDIVNLGLSLKGKIDYNNLIDKLRFLRKYHNDSRYPFNSEIYTKDFFEECRQVTIDTKAEIDRVNDIKGDVQKLKEKFGESNVRDDGYL